MLTRYLDLKILFSSRIKWALTVLVIVSVVRAGGHEAAPLSFIQNPEVGYYKLLLGRFYDWYSNKFFNFDKANSIAGRKLVQSVIDDIDKSTELLDSTTHMSRFRLSMEFENEKTYFGNLALLFSKADLKQQELIEKVLLENGLANYRKNKNFPLRGIEWAFDKKEISLFYIVSDGDEKSNHDDDVQILQVVYSKGVPVDEITWKRNSDVLEGETSLFANGISDAWEVKSKGAAKKYVVTSAFPTMDFSDIVKKPLREVSKEFGFVPKSILIENRTKLKIFYQ